MTVKRMDHVGIVVSDIEYAKAFFVELGLAVVAGQQVEGEWVDRIIGLEGARSEIAMLETPDGHSRVELVQFYSPPSPSGDPQAPSNSLGVRHVCFAVDDVDDVVARLQAIGSELVGNVEQFKDMYRLCYIRGPEGIIVELAEELS